MPVLSRKDIESGIAAKPAPADIPEKAVAVTAPLSPAEAPALPRARPNPGAPWFYLQHPDATDGNQINATFDVAGETVKIERSRVETQSQEVRDELVRRGWRWMNEEF